MFPLVEIEKLSFNDSFLQYNPKTTNEKRVKDSIVKAKEMEMKNFRKAAMDPLFADDRDTVIYGFGKKPAVGPTGLYWERKFKSFFPEKIVV